MTKREVLTREGYVKLKDELKDLVEIQRPKIASLIQEAREMGDVLNNLPYDYSLEQQGMIEARIKEIQEVINSAQIIDTKKLSSDVVELGARLNVKINDNKVTSIKIVSSLESDPSRGYISADSPVGRELIGKKIGEVVKVETPALVITYKILGISY